MGINSLKHTKIPSAIIIPDIEPNDYEFGGMTPLGHQAVFPNGNVVPYLPHFETQSAVYFDTWGCVAHSFLNGCEAFIEATDLKNDSWIQDNIYKAGKPNFSDRDLVVLSGTVIGQGNNGTKVLQAASVEGLIPQGLGDWDMTNRDPLVNIPEVYYAYGRTPEAQAKANEWNQRYLIIGEWVNRPAWEQASKEGAIQVYVNAWYENNGVYYNPTGNHNHAVLLADFHTTRIFDTYQPDLKKLSSWNDCFHRGLKINIIKKHMEKPNLIDNTLVILVEGVGGIGLHLDDKIIVDDVAKVLSVFMARNAKDGNFNGGPVRSLTQEDWDKFEKRTL
jgi:hypothetical protein